MVSGLDVFFGDFGGRDKSLPELVWGESTCAIDIVENHHVKYVNCHISNHWMAKAREQPNESLVLQSHWRCWLFLSKVSGSTGGLCEGTGARKAEESIAN